MQWVVENWVLLLLLGGMLAMHLFGHGHGNHGKKKTKKVPKPDAKSDARADDKPGEER